MKKLFGLIVFILCFSLALASVIIGGSEIYYQPGMVSIQDRTNSKHLVLWRNTPKKQSSALREA